MAKDFFLLPRCYLLPFSIISRNIKNVFFPFCFKRLKNTTKTLHSLYYEKAILSCKKGTLKQIKPLQISPKSALKLTAPAQPPFVCAAQTVEALFPIRLRLGRLWHVQRDETPDFDRSQSAHGRRNQNCRVETAEVQSG